MGALTRLRFAGQAGSGRLSPCSAAQATVDANLSPMQRSILSFFLAAACCLSAPVKAGDSRELVELPAPMVQHMLSNMRDHLTAIAAIQRALGAGEFQHAGEVAEQRIGLSSLEAHGASHMAPYMPKAMQDIGTRMHRAASQFALVAQETGADGNVAKAIAALAKVTEQCVACHAAYRAH
jgi:hypothetical protein